MELSPHYTGFFEKFNRGEYFEAHDVLEELWLKDKYGPNGAFYKGLIQLAGAFVHVQKGRTEPAISLLKLAEKNLSPYPEGYQTLDLAKTLRLIRKWRADLEQTMPEVLIELHEENQPRIVLLG